LNNFLYYILYKPFNVLNQFSKEHVDHVTLADYIQVPKDVYPIGRLDKDSEGLLILSNDKLLNHLLLSPSLGHKRTYIVQLDGDVTDTAIIKAAQGVEIKVESGIYRTKPCDVKKLPKEPLLPERNPPIRFRKEIPTSWALITLTEGKNRQVRKVFAAVGFPVLRLVRVQIEDLKIGKLLPGESKSIPGAEMYKLLNIDPSAVKTKKPKVQAAKSDGKHQKPKSQVAANKAKSYKEYRKSSTKK
jgi:23S rRNA pseudouridine2457 synthase